MSGHDCDVLVVGLGPAGDVLAGLLAAQGRTVIAVDREAGIFPLPRAAAFDQEVMRIFQMLGAAEGIEPHCRVPTTYRFETANGEVLLEFPTSQAVGRWGWMPTYFLHQPAVEAVLRKRAAALGAELRVSTTLLDADQDADGVTVRLEGSGGDPHELRARFLVGCDGAWSPVRAAIGGGLDDYGFEEPWLVVDAIVENGDDLPRYAMQICDPERPTTFLRMAGDRYRWEFMMKPGEDPATFANDESLARLLGPWNVLARARIDRRAIYRFRALVATRWRDRRLLIAGDAAHQMPPFAGQGMCSGVRDAANLAWKLSAVLGGADDALLDTYQVEREPHVRAIIAAAIAMGQTVCVLDPAAAAERDAGMLARKASGAQDVSVDWPPLAGGCLTGTPGAGALFVQPVDAGGRRLDDVLGAGAWLIEPGAGEGVGDDGIARFGLDGPTLHPFAAPLRDWLSRPEADAVLVRPDRHVFGTGSAVALQEAWRRALAAPPAITHA